MVLVSTVVFGQTYQGSPKDPPEEWKMPGPPCLLVPLVFSVALAKVEGLMVLFSCWVAPRARNVVRLLALRA
eukprot:1890650-Amphidinium_carterae.1